MNNEWQKKSSKSQDISTEDHSSALQFDPEKYREYMDGSGLSESAKDEYLKLIWSMMSTFVDVAWGVDPAQTVLPPFAELFAESINGLPEAKNKTSPTEENSSPTSTVKTSSTSLKKARTRRS